jgi:drug/metabolite transporter (DMT)-like permease
VGFALLSAALFGASTPFAKLLVGELPPLMLAGLLYAGSGVGLLTVLLVRSRGERKSAPLARADLPWLGGAIFFGGILAPISLMTGLQATPSSTAALLLNLEGLFTSLLAWFVFKENFDRRVAAGMALILAAGLILSLPEADVSVRVGSLLVAVACACWAVDNNLTQKVSGGDPLLIAGLKGLVAGVVNIAIASSLHQAMPSLRIAGAAMVVGLLGYGVSLVLFVLALRHLGTARTGAYFSSAPFIGSAVSLLVLREPVGLTYGVAALLMAAGVYLHLTERHEHEHSHEVLEHSHRHVHDDHHQHEHALGVDPTAPHTHVHRHEPLVHSHPHYPDIHHRHAHQAESRAKK